MAMKILITGAAGFIGRELTTQLLASPVINGIPYTLILADVSWPPIPSCNGPHTIRVEVFDLSANTGNVVPPGVDVVFMLHGIADLWAERNFCHGMQANFEATKHLLNGIGVASRGARVIYASSILVYGPPASIGATVHVSEAALPTPTSSYGTQKLMCEALINLYTGRGLIDGLALRFPTISVSSGEQEAASSFLSSIIRNPLCGDSVTLPIDDHGLEFWICSPKTLIKNLIHALTLPLNTLEPHLRQVNLPGNTVTVAEMLDTMERVAGAHTRELVSEQRVEDVNRIVASWPARFDTSLAERLGFSRDGPFEEAVGDFVAVLSKTEQAGP